MEVIRYMTTLKASGEEYIKIVFWNRFLRNKTELVLSFLPTAVCIILIATGFFSTFLILPYAIFILYPVFSYLQFKKAVNYHLKHRDPSESAPCEITFMDNGILAEVPEFNARTLHRWDEFTTIYDKCGYYMMFQKADMLVMLRKEDIPEALKRQAAEYIRSHINQNECMVLF